MGSFSIPEIEKKIIKELITDFTLYNLPNDFGV